MRLPDVYRVFGFSGTTDMAVKGSAQYFPEGAPMGARGSGGSFPSATAIVITFHVRPVFG